MIDKIKWFGHGSFLILGDINIYIDPWRVVKTGITADLILISHDHYDHCSSADVDKLRRADTTVIGNARVAQKIDDVTRIRPWQSMSFDRLSIKAIPAYSPHGVLHPQEHGGLGFVISVNYYDIYYAGDTKVIPEMSRISPDIVILPIDGDDTMTLDEARQAVEILRPRYVLPANWGITGEGATRIDALEFKEHIGGRADVIIPEPLTRDHDI